MAEPNRERRRQLATLTALMRAFDQVLRDVGATVVADHLPWRSSWQTDEDGKTCAAFDDEHAEACVQAYSIAFQLFAMADENGLAQHRRALEDETGLANESGSWDRVFASATDMPDEELASLIRGVRVEPVLTAHPTEAKRETVLEHHRESYRLLVELENTMWTASERAGLEERLRACIERLWRTGEIYLEKPSIDDERRLILFYLRGALPAALRWSDLTEQGETISQRYANRVTAAHHLELLTAGTLHATLGDRRGRDEPEALLATMDRIARTSQAAYRQLIEREGFLPFFRQATPVDAIEASRIGSRPARRTGKPSLGDLRAIPWVFAWNQSRFGLPGWFGLGSALLTLRGEDGPAFEALVAAKREASRWAPLHYLVSNAATAWMTSSAPVMARYAELVDDASIRRDLLEHVLAEHQRTQEALEAIYEAPLVEVREEIALALEMRNEALLPLHDHQIALLRRWRSATDETRERILPQLLLTVNAIASGLGATG